MCSDIRIWYKPECQFMHLHWRRTRGTPSWCGDHLLVAWRAENWSKKSGSFHRKCLSHSGSLWTVLFSWGRGFSPRIREASLNPCLNEVLYLPLTPCLNSLFLCSVFFDGVSPLFTGTRNRGPAGFGSWVHSCCCLCGFGQVNLSALQFCHLFKGENSTCITEFLWGLIEII